MIVKMMFNAVKILETKAKGADSASTGILLLSLGLLGLLGLLWVVSVGEW